MAQYDGSLKFDTNIDSKGFNSGVKNISSSFNDILKTLKLVGTAIAGAFVTKEIIDCTKEAEKYQNALTGLQSIMDGQGKSFSKAQKFIKSYTEDGLIPQTEAITAYKNLALRGYDTSQIEKVMVALKDAATYSRQSSYTLGEAVETASEGLKNENSILVDNAGVTKNVAKMWDEYAKSIGKTRNNLTQQEKIQAEVNGILEETKFQTGDAEKYTNSYSGMIARLSASFTTLKQTLGSAFIQIFQAVLPIIQSVLNVLIKLANVFAQVVSLIFGKQVDTNKSLAKSSKTAASAIEKQGNAAEKAGKQAKGALLNFDKLNVLDEETNSTASGSSSDISGADISDPLEGLELGNNLIISPKVQEAFDSVKKIFDSFKNWVNINFTPIFESIAKEMAPKIDTLKGIISGIFSDLSTLKAPLQDYFNNSFTPFLQQLVTSIGNFANEFLNTFNIVFSSLWDVVAFPVLQNFITVGLPLITDFCTQMLSTLDVLVDSVFQIFNKLYLEGVEPILSSIVTIWNNCWISLQSFWEKWGQPIFDNIKTAITGIKDTLINIWNTAIKPVWDTICDNIDWLWTKHLKPLLDNFLDFVGELVNGALEIYNKFILPVVNFLTDILGPTFTAIFSTISGWVGTTIGWIIDIINSLITFLKGLIQFITGVFTGNWKKAWEGIVNIFKSLFEGIASSVKWVINIVIDVINGLIQGVISGVNSILNKINSVSSKVGIPSVPTLSAPQIPKLATGAVIPPRQEFIAVLGDQKNGKNIEAPEGLIRQIIREENNNGSGAKTIITKVYLDKRQIAEAVAEVENGEEITSPSIDGGGSFVY